MQTITNSAERLQRCYELAHAALGDHNDYLLVEARNSLNEGLVSVASEQLTLGYDRISATACPDFLNAPLRESCYLKRDPLQPSPGVAFQHFYHSELKKVLARGPQDCFGSGARAAPVLPPPQVRRYSDWVRETGEVSDRGAEVLARLFCEGLFEQQGIEVEVPEPAQTQQQQQHETGTELGTESVHSREQTEASASLAHVPSVRGILSPCVSWSPGPSGTHGGTPENVGPRPQRPSSAPPGKGSSRILRDR
eukprot:TRINITY_DN4695_c1_g1_i5.p1 TRINITY_DN4695_c1_g1~~TRINITY_DN4695_c1_g1_i5.p1  ORF type:complete len:252 (+),score=39.87 TRINITY_DN4695_c1_g1_i5:223-978(+)